MQVPAPPVAERMTCGAWRATLLPTTSRHGRQPCGTEGVFRWTMRDENSCAPAAAARIAMTWQRQGYCSAREGRQLLVQLTPLAWLDSHARAQLRRYRWGLALVQRRRLWDHLSQAIPSLRKIRGDSDDARRVVEFTAFAEALDPSRAVPLPGATVSRTRLSRLLILAAARHVRAAIRRDHGPERAITVARMTTDTVRYLFPDVCAGTSVEQVRRRLRYWTGRDHSSAGFARSSRRRHRSLTLAGGPPRRRR